MRREGDKEGKEDGSGRRREGREGREGRRRRSK